MKFSDLICCPFCGNDEFFSRVLVGGHAIYNQRFDGREAHNEEMYDYLSYTDGGKRWCSNCGSYLGNAPKNTVSKAALAALRAMNGGNDDG